MFPLSQGVRRSGTKFGFKLIKMKREGGGLPKKTEGTGMGFAKEIEWMDSQF